jgi:DNA processing protein
LSKFTDAEEIYRADESGLRGAIDRRASDRSALLNKDLTKAEEILEFCRSKRVGVVTYADPTYPDALRKIPNPPVLLYYRGVWHDFNSGGFYSAIVGTRSVSDYGRKNTFVIARDLARAGATVVSGMAIGIDGVALAGALSVNAPTVAVIGSGIDVCYPAQHITLAREIVKRGCVITEFAPGTPPNRFNFPKRNRIISGLSAVTLVMEGRENSGALITARCAQEQGRIVYALPGNVSSPTSEVTNLLLKNGARALVSADDIVRDFETEYHGKLNPFKLAE